MSVDRRAQRELAGFGAAVGDPSRAAMLIALVGGVARPASELAQVAGVAPSTATTHLRHLVEAGLVTVHAQGRHRYFALAGPRVADAVERVVTLIDRPAARPAVEDALARARTCYAHLAGRVAIAFWTRAVDARWVRWSDASVTLLPRGHETLVARGLLEDTSLPLAGSACLDWSERVPHVAGRLGIALCASLIARGWVKRIEGGRALRITARGDDGLRALGIPTPR